ncbi:MAG TPA: bile acid:sodium symporter family protein [Sphingomonadaceae bacterium]|jgi:sodium/bile acid cotransporter 7|nr:bile acid:sodium symporter family protein [Sphingomonadaceae bacterium]
MKLDGFLLATLAAVFAALVAPSIGAAGGPLHLDVVTTVGIAIMFFLHGAALSPQALKAGAANWRLHLLVHGSTYLLFPAIGFAFFLLGAGLAPAEVRLGVFYLCAVSSTISSSVAMTAIGKGNVAGAIFDATLSGLLGMVLTPLLVGLVVASGSGHLPLLPAILDVVKTLLLPFAAGQIARPLIAGLLHRHEAGVANADRAVIVLIVYAAFCDSSAAGLWSRYDPLLILGVAVMMLVLLVLILFLTTGASRLLGFSRADEVAAVFCGSKKSLANGAPIAAVLFAGNPALGMIMLPLLLYHQMQLVLCSILARRYAERAARELAPDPSASVASAGQG